MPTISIPSRRQKFTQRPEVVFLNKAHFLADGLVFCGAGSSPGTDLCWDSSLYGDHGTLINMDSNDWVWESELNRYALDLDGTDDHMAGTHSLLSGGPYTVCCWLRPDSSNTGTEVFVTLGSDNTIRFQKWNTNLYHYYNVGGSAYTLQVDSVLTYDEWQHWAFVCEDGRQEAFVNGVAVGNNTNAGTPDAPNNSTLWWGRYGTGAYFTGRVSDLAIYDRALTNAEIRIHANKSDPMLGGLLQPTRRKWFPVKLPETPPTDLGVPYVIKSRRKKTSTAVSSRPESFTIDPSHYLADGLLFGGFAAFSGAEYYHDSTQYAKHGTFVDMQADSWEWIDELGRSALNFDGVDNEVQCGQISPTLWTIACFVRIPLPTTSNYYRHILSKGGVFTSNTLFNLYYRERIDSEDWGVWVDAGGTDYYAFTEPDKGDPDIQNDIWHHIAGSWDGTNIRLFLAGEEVIPNSVSHGAGADGGREVVIGGSDGSGSDRNMIGRIADPVIYDRPLTTSELSVLANPDDPFLDGLIQPLRTPKTTVFLPEEAPPVGAVPYVISRRRRSSNLQAGKWRFNPASSFAEGLIGWYPLGEYPDGRDLSLYRSDIGTWTGSPTFGVIAGRKALNFPTTNDFYTTNTDVTGDFLTIVCSVYLNGPVTRLGIIGTGGGGDTSSGILTWSSRWNWLDSGGFDVWPVSPTPSAGQWYRMVGVHYRPASTTFAELFLDGISISTGDSPNPVEGWGTARIGHDYSVNGALAWIDDVRIYNRAWSASEVAQDYQQTLGGGYGDLLVEDKKTTVFLPAEEAPPFLGGIPHVIKSRRKKTSTAISSRPESFTIDPSHYLSEGCVFAGLGQVPGSVDYFDNSHYKNFGTLLNMSPAEDWGFDNKLSRYVVNGITENGSEAINCGNDESLRLSEFTFCCWIYRDEGFTGFHTIAERFTGAGGNSSWQFRYNTTSGYNPVTLALRTHNGSATTEISGAIDLGSPPGEFVHVACGHDGIGNGYLWVNGVFDVSAPTNIPMNTDSSDLFLGNSSGSGRSVSGGIADCLYWGRLLKNSEIQTLANPEDPSLDGWIQSLRTPKTTVFLPETQPEQPPTDNQTPPHLFQVF